MKRSGLRKEIIMLIITIMLIFSCAVPSSANSGRYHWTGVTSTGAIITDENCPIVVESEQLTFDVQEFPKSYYDTLEEYLAYNGRVTAKYNFYNPSDYTVKATLVFPFGNTPDYYPDSDISAKSLDAEKYDITVNGAVIEKKLRYTSANIHGDFNLKKHISKLDQGYMSDSFYSPDMPVTKYTYYISGIDKEKHASPYASLFLSIDSNKYRVFLPEEGRGISSKKNGVEIFNWVDNGSFFSIYIIGQPPEEALQWILYEDSEEKQKIQGNITLKVAESITLEEFALIEYPENSLVSKEDWYNAFLANLKRNQWENGLIIGSENGLSINNSLMRWYEYEITIEPGERIVNEVTAPIYPSIDKDYNPNIYGYTYLLSPAKTWADFGPLEVYINTHYYITESSIEGFSKVENGYSLFLDGLPDGELQFTLSKARKPKVSIFRSSYMWYIIILAIGACAFLIGCGFIAFFIFLNKKSKGINKK